MKIQTVLVTGIMVMSGSLAIADLEDHQGFVHQHRSAAYEINRTDGTEQPMVSNATDGKKLPGRDCKVYDGSTRWHGWPAYEIGNANRPECPPKE